MRASVVKAAAVRPAAIAAAARPDRDERDGTDTKRQGRHAHERRQQAPDDEESADEVDMGIG